MFFFAPCRETITIEKQPVDLVFMLDASGSIDEDSWDQEIEGTKKWIEVFQDDIPQLQISIIPFSTEAFVYHELNDTSSVIDSLDNLDQDMQYTNYIAALDEFEEQIALHRQEDSFICGVMISDGQPYVDIYDPYDFIDWSVERAGELKDENFTIVGVIVQNVREGQTLFDVSSCDDYRYWERDECENFFEAENWDLFTDNVKNISASIVDQVGDVSRNNCEDAWSLIFLLLTLPLLILLILQFCFNKTRKIVVKTKKEKPKGDPLARERTVSQAAVVPDFPKPNMVKKKKYKWEVDTGHYLWNTSGGTAPMKVDFGEKAPPSAPLDALGGRRRRTVEAWEDADGWEYECIEEKQTLELVVEDAIATNLSFLAKWCGCCCCCRQKAPKEDRILE